jgi:hypothetical protein
MNEGCCSVWIDGMGKDETADERERAIEWLGEIEVPAADLVEIVYCLRVEAERSGLAA